MEGCDDLVEDEWLAMADVFGDTYSSENEFCETADTYGDWFQKAWDDRAGDSTNWTIQFRSAYFQDAEGRRLPESGIHPQDSESQHHGIGIKDEYSPGVGAHEVYHHENPHLEEDSVNNWMFYTTKNCYKREDEEEDDDENNNGNGNSGGGGGGGGGGSTEGGGTTDDPDTCVPDRLVWVRHEGTCSESEEEDDSNCGQFHPDGHPLCTLPGLTACGAEDYYTSHLVEGTCSSN